MPAPAPAAAKRSPQRHTLKHRGNDCYETAPEAVYPVLHEVPHVSLDTCCGSGAIVKMVRATGRIMHAYDLVDYGLEDSMSRIDFLLERTLPPGTEAIVTNPPNKLATDQAAQSLVAGVAGGC